MNRKNPHPPAPSPRAGEGEPEIIEVSKSLYPLGRGI